MRRLDEVVQGFLKFIRPGGAPAPTRAALRHPRGDHAGGRGGSAIARRQGPDRVFERSAAPQRRLGRARAGVSEPGHQRLPGHSVRRYAAHRGGRSPGPTRRGRFSKTPAWASRRNTSRRSSTSTSRRKNVAAASDSRWSSAPCTCTTERSRCSRRPDAARRSDCSCRRPELRRCHQQAAAASAWLDPHGSPASPVTGSGGDETHLRC